MFKASKLNEVGTILREAAERAVLPRFALLAPEESRFKSPQEVVTIADLEAEQILTNGLGRLLPQARVVGEEACSEQPNLLSNLDQGTVWLVDPLDGTRNFVAGRAPFAMMVALLQDGVTVRSWILDPLTGRLAEAELGGGAWLDGERLSAGGPGRPLSQLQGIVSDAFVPAEERTFMRQVCAAVAGAIPTERCAGHEYPVVAQGVRDFAIYWRTLAWDHAPGALLLTEAGGRVCHWDGAAYDPAAARPGLLLAHHPDIAERFLEFRRARER